MNRIEVEGVGCASLDEIRANAVHSTSLGIPQITREGLHGRPLAVVGGGPSVSAHLDELRDFSDIWAINGTCQWLADQGIRATLFSVDPDQCLTPLATGVTRAILASHCHPAAFATLIEQGADVRTFNAPHIEGMSQESRPMALRREFRIATGTTSACSVPCAALRMGYQRVTYFGCEGSFLERSHVYKDDEKEGQLIVRAGGADYRTTMQFYMQSRALAGLIQLFPAFLHEKSGGLLRAMVEHPDTWEVVAVSESLRYLLEPETVVPYKYG